MGDPAEDLSQVKMMLLPDVMPWDELLRAMSPRADRQPPESHPVAYYCISDVLEAPGPQRTVVVYFMNGERDDARLRALRAFSSTGFCCTWRAPSWAALETIE
jgi:hypothetical protein